MADMNAETEPLREDADSMYATEQEYDSSEIEWSGYIRLYD
jgi:hypothetical protein